MSDKLLKELLITGQIDLDWAIKNIFNDSKSKYRKFKIERLLNGKTRKIR